VLAGSPGHTQGPDEVHVPGVERRSRAPRAQRNDIGLSGRVAHVGLRSSTPPERLGSVRTQDPVSSPCPVYGRPRKATQRCALRGAGPSVTVSGEPRGCQRRGRCLKRRSSGWRDAMSRSPIRIVAVLTAIALSALATHATGHSRHHSSPDLELRQDGFFTAGEGMSQAKGKLAADTRRASPD
jgi:hypothetical protein